MANFNYSINAESAVKEYDNQGAYNTLQEMMKRKEQLTVKFYGGKDNIPCAWIESAHVAGFKYQLKNKKIYTKKKCIINIKISKCHENIFPIL